LNAIDSAQTQAADVARTLVGDAVEVNLIQTGGRNSRIWRVRNGERTFALKQYPPRSDDPRDRLSTEIGALRLMERYRIEVVPRVLGVDAERGYALLSWIEGRDVAAIGDDDIDAAVEFLAAIHELRTTDWAANQPLASEACLSGAEVERQIEARRVRLRGLPHEPELIEFIELTVGSTVAESDCFARAGIAAAGIDFGRELPQEWRSLVPSDFGFHNSMRRSDRSLAFVDFEYFGWDDPVKLTADILLHPGQALLSPQLKRFRQAALCLYGYDRNFADRLRAYLPLFGLRWVLILLNEFIPERWQRRVLAGDTGSWAEAKARQLSRAREFLAALPEKLEE
jgi:hypothetical protein